MNSPLRALRLTLLFPLLLLSPACQHRSTTSSLVRTERPAVPTLPSELTKTERLRSIKAVPTGELVTIDKGVLGELYEWIADAAGAVARLNTRMVGVVKERHCTTAIMETGTAPADCTVVR